MTEQQCVSCKDIESMYEQCSDCKLLISRSDKNQEKTTKKGVTKQRKKKKQRILSTLDILISVFVVTPLVISVWRGTWQLMDIYSHYFPPWESVIIGTMVHIILTISQESFHDILIKKRSSWILNAVFLLLMKSYTIVFNAVTNMHWRGTWMILDEYFGILFVEPGATEVKYGRQAFAFFTVAFLIMFCLKSLRNLNSPPFEICLDYGDDMFLFPNMFKVKVTVFAVIGATLRIHNLEIGENDNLSTRQQRFIGPKFRTVRDESYGRPFRIDFHGERPRFFTITSTTTKRPIYRNRMTHMMPYRAKYYPQSIQEIIANDMLQDDIFISKSFNFHHIDEPKYLENKSHEFRQNDRLYEFRPLQPGEVNLMAVSSYRFCPPVWKSYHSKYHRDVQAQQVLSRDKESEHSNVSELNKPISFILNVMPMKQTYHHNMMNYLKEIKSRLKKSEAEAITVSEKLSLYILDVIFSVGVVTNLGIIVWRGLWLLIDVYFFSYDQVVSSWASAFLGYIMVALVFLSQTIMKQFCDNLSGIPKLLVADTYIMFSVMAVILVWRGIWDLLNIYFLPDYPELSCWISHWIPMLILILMGCSNSVLVRGITADCEEPDGTCVVFPCNYLRVLLDQEKKDTWTSIWHGKNKTDQLFKSKIINTTDHIVRINENKNHDTRNNNIT